MVKIPGRRNGLEGEPSAEGCHRRRPGPSAARRRRPRLVPAGDGTARQAQPGGGRPAAGARRGRRAGFPDGPRGAGPGPVRRRLVHRGRRKLPDDRGGQPGRRLRALRSGPRAGPLRRAGPGGRVSRPGRRDAARTCRTTRRRCATSGPRCALASGRPGKGGTRPRPAMRGDRPSVAGGPPAMRSWPQTAPQSRAACPAELPGAAQLGLRRGPARPGRRRLPGRRRHPGRGRGAGQGDRRRHAAGVRHEQRLPHPGRDRAPSSPGSACPLAPADIVTSAQAAARLLAERLPAGSAVLVVGGHRAARGGQGARPAPGLRRPRTSPPLSSRDTRRTSATRTWPRARWPSQAGALFVASNADPTLPTPRGRQPGNGSHGAGHRHRHRRQAADRGQAGAPAARRVRAADRRQAAAGGRRPAGHRHRGRLPGGRGQPARADRGQRAGGRPARAARGSARPTWPEDLPACSARTPR